MLLEIPPPSANVTAADYNALAKIAFAFRNAIVGPGLFLILTADLSQIGLASDDAGGVSQTESNIDLPEIIFVQPGDNINPDHWNAIVTVANSFSTLQGIRNINVTLADELFTIEMANAGQCGATNGAVALLEKLNSPFPSRDFFERLAKRLNTILHILGTNNVAIIPSETNVVFQLGVPLPAIADQNQTAAPVCELPDSTLLLAQLIAFNGFLNSTSCGGILTHANDSLIVGIFGTATCLYRFRVTLEARLPANRTGSAASASIDFDGTPENTLTLTGDDGPNTCGMIVKTVTKIVEISPSDPPLSGGLMGISLPASSNWDNACVKVTAMEFLGSRSV